MVQPNASTTPFAQNHQISSSNKQFCRVREYYALYHLLYCYVYMIKGEFVRIVLKKRSLLL